MVTYILCSVPPRACPVSQFSPERRVTPGLRSGWVHTRTVPRFRTRNVATLVASRAPTVRVIHPVYLHPGSSSAFQTQISTPMVFLAPRVPRSAHMQPHLSWICNDLIRIIPLRENAHRVVCHCMLQMWSGTSFESGSNRSGLSSPGHRSRHSGLAEGVDVSVEPHAEVEGDVEATVSLSVRGDPTTDPDAASSACSLCISVTACQTTAIPGPGTISLLIRGSDCPGPAMFASVTPGGNVRIDCFSPTSTGFRHCNSANRANSSGCSSSDGPPNSSSSSMTPSLRECD